jgi:hypothetical protein
VSTLDVPTPTLDANNCASAQPCARARNPIAFEIHQLRLVDCTTRGFGCGDPIFSRVEGARVPHHMSAILGGAGVDIFSRVEKYSVVCHTIQSRALAYLREGCVGIQSSAKWRV